MAFDSEKSGSPTGLTADEAKAFHGLFTQGFLGFMFLALIVHILVWSLRPWGWLGADSAALDVIKPAAAAFGLPLA